MECSACHPCGTSNFEVGTSFLENLCTPGSQQVLCRSPHCVDLVAGYLISWTANLGMNDFVSLSVTFHRHARKYFTIFEDEQLLDVQHCMALLAFPATTGTIFSSSCGYYFQSSP